MTETFTVTWGRPDDDITVGSDGLSFGSGCCGCSSTPLTDRGQLTQLRDALTAYLEETSC